MKIPPRGQTSKLSMDVLGHWEVAAFQPIRIKTSCDGSREVLTTEINLLSRQNLDNFSVTKHLLTVSCSEPIVSLHLVWVMLAPSLKHSRPSQYASSDNRCKIQWKKKMIKYMCILQLNCRKVMVLDNSWFTHQKMATSNGSNSTLRRRFCIVATVETEFSCSVRQLS